MQREEECIGYWLGKIYCVIIKWIKIYHSRRYFIIKTISRTTLNVFEYRSLDHNLNNCKVEILSDKFLERHICFKNMKQLLDLQVFSIIRYGIGKDYFYT